MILEDPRLVPPLDELLGRLRDEFGQVIGLPARDETVVNDHLRGCFRATDYTQPPID